MDDASADLLEQHLPACAAAPVARARSCAARSEEGFRPGRGPTHVVPLRPARSTLRPRRSSRSGQLEDTTLTPEDVASLTRASRRQPAVPARSRARGSHGRAARRPPRDARGPHHQPDRPAPAGRAHPAALRLGARRGVPRDRAAAAYGGAPAPDRRDALRRLSYFIRQEGHGRYRFDHQLIRDTAYEGLPYRLPSHAARPRRRGHRGERRGADEVAELLSFHFLHAGAHGQGVGLLAPRRAARAATSTPTPRPRSCSSARPWRHARCATASTDRPRRRAGGAGRGPLPAGTQRPALAAYQRHVAQMTDDPVRAALAAQGGGVDLLPAGPALGGAAQLSRGCAWSSRWPRAGGPHGAQPARGCLRRRPREPGPLPRRPRLGSAGRGARRGLRRSRGAGGCARGGARRAVDARPRLRPAVRRGGARRSTSSR